MPAAAPAKSVAALLARVLETYYADTNLTQSFNLTNTITGSGRLSIGGQNGTDGKWFLGHLSSSTSSERSMIGIEFAENTSTSVRFYAKVGSPNGANNSSGSPIVLNNGAYNYTYTYDPSLGTNGRLTVRIYNDALTYDQTNLVNIRAPPVPAAQRSTPLASAPPRESMAGSMPTNTSTCISTMYPTAAKTPRHHDQRDRHGYRCREPGTDTGTFTITRTGSSGDLTVYYTVSGTATSGSDLLRDRQFGRDSQWRDLRHRDRHATR